MSAPAPIRDWTLDGRCFGEDPAIWDAGGEDDEPRRESERDAWDRAWLACLGCTVKRACALDALAHGDEHTIRAGVPLHLAERSPAQARKVTTRLRQAAGLGPIRDRRRTA